MRIVSVIAMVTALLAGAIGAAIAQTPTTPPPAPATATEVNEAGVIELVEGQVNVLDTNRKRRTVKVGDKLFEGDSVVTGKNGELHAELLDGGVLAIRPDTAMRIIKYQANGDSTDTSIFGLLKGSFRSITGWIGKSSPANYQIRTPSATIGVRGTDHEPLVIPPGAASGEAGTYDRVNIGTSSITGANGAVDVTPGRAGFFAQHGRDRPRVLDRVPPQFRPTRNEDRLQGRHDRVQAAVERRRTQRQQVIQERIKQRQERGQTKAGERPNDKREAAQAKQRERAEQRQKAEQTRQQQAEERRRQAEQQRRQRTEERQKKAQEQRMATQREREARNGTEHKRAEDKRVENKRAEPERERRGNR